VRLKVELHAHTWDDPHDLIPHSAEDLIDRAAALDYHAIAITLHDKQLDLQPHLDHARARGIVLIPGVERMIEGCHVLLINFSAASETIDSFEDLAALRARERGLVVAPHAFYPAAKGLGRLADRHGALVDAIEVHGFYPRGIDVFNDRARRWARTHRKPLVGNSEVHRLIQLGTTYSIVEADPTPQSICEAIRAGRVEVHSEPLGWVRLAALLADMLAAEWRSRRARRRIAR
jgi:predicted metal-dependent phosphoesterase TrpH